MSSTAQPAARNGVYLLGKSLGGRDFTDNPTMHKQHTHTHTCTPKRSLARLVGMVEKGNWPPWTLRPLPAPVNEKQKLGKRKRKRGL